MYSPQVSLLNRANCSVWADKFPTCSPWQKNYNSPLANHIKCSDYFDKFSLLTHTDKQNLYFDNFFYDKCTCSKASMLASY
jgi:hypothetical protein